jgi:hypothetical protein
MLESLEALSLSTGSAKQDMATFAYQTSNRQTNA